MLNLADYYLLLGLFMHLAFLGLVDWLGYHHLVTHGYDHTVLLLALLNVAIFFGLYYLVFLPVRRSVRARRMLRAAGRQHGQS